MGTSGIEIAVYIGGPEDDLHEPSFDFKRELERRASNRLPVGSDGRQGVMKRVA